jgi:hypothetical protein
MKYEDIKEFSQRCEEHPDHQSGMISNSMIQQRLHEEIDELREYIEQRTWVGLTDEEYTHITDTVFHTGQGLVAYYRAIEAKLKEKNNAA